MFSRCLTWRERPALAKPPEVSLHRGEADIEGASSFDLSHASLLDGANDLRSDSMFHSSWTRGR